MFRFLKSLNIKVDVFIILPFVIMVLFNGWIGLLFALLFIFSMFFHEVGHVLVGRKVGFNIENMNFNFFGASSITSFKELQFP